MNVDVALIVRHLYNGHPVPLDKNGAYKEEKERREWGC